MATADQVSALVRAHQMRDRVQFERYARIISASERKKGRTTLADNLDHLLGRDMKNPIPTDKDGSTPLAQLREANRGLGTLSLRPDTGDTLRRFVDEVGHWPAFAENEIPRRRKVLLYGPAGCGKTSVAAALAVELELPFVSARADGLLSSFLGASNRNLTQLFDWVEQNPCVLLLDEFDSLASTRDNDKDVGEMRRIVNALLQVVETLQGDSIVVAATNFDGLIDKAMWRRFDVVAELPLPNAEERLSILNRLLGERATNGDLAEQTEARPHAAVEFLANAIRRSALVGGRTEPSAADIELGLDETVSRRW